MADEVPVIIDIDDLPDSITGSTDQSLLQLMLAGANAQAIRVAPCLKDPTPEQADEAKLVLVGSIKRWSEAGSGAYTQEQMTSGPFSMNHSIDTRQRTGFSLWPSEIEQLQGICAGESETKKAFVIDQVQPTGDDLINRPDLQFQWGWPGA